MKIIVFSTDQAKGAILRELKNERGRKPRTKRQSETPELNLFSNGVKRNIEAWRSERYAS